MEFFSKTRTTKGVQAGNRPIASNVLRIEHDDPKQRFGHSLTTIRHERSDAFNDAITRFLYEMDLNEIAESDLRGLVHGCMEHREIAALREILPLYMGFDYKILRIEQPVSTDGWQTLVKATKEAPLFVEALAISGFNLDYSKGRFFFEVLGQMPALRTLHLGSVGVESAILFSMLKCSDLELETVMVSAGVTDDVDVFPLLFKLLEVCNLSKLNLMDFGSVTIAQHEKLCQAIMGQVELKSLQLACYVQKNFMACYMPFFEMRTPLEVLDLNSCDVGTPLCNKLLEVLPRSKPDLYSLSLASCNLQPCGGPDGRLQISHIAKLPKLLELDLSCNPLDDGTIVPLLLSFEQKKAAGLQRLNLNATMVGDDTANALGSLLTKQATLVSVSFVSNGRRDDFFLKPLVEALRQNTTLLQLDVSKFAVGAWRDELRDHLARNRNTFKMAVANGMWHGVSVLLGGRFYDDIVNRIIDTAEFSDRDAMALSSFHPTAWAERHKTLQMDGVPK